MTYDRAVVKGDAKIIAAINGGTVLPPGPNPNPPLVPTSDDDPQTWSYTTDKVADAPGYAGDYAAVPISEAARAAMKPGRNVLAVHCHQTVGGQGIDVGIAAAEEEAK